MSDLVSAGDIERIVGARRHATEHLGRVDSAAQRVYVLHSAACLESEIDLRDCLFSIALDGGIKLHDWRGQEDRPVRLDLGLCDGRLVPRREDT